MTPQWYIQNVHCLYCREKCNLRAFHFCGNGTIKLIGWCSICGKQTEFLTESETLVLWARHKDNPFPTEKDKEFLHDLRISCEEPKQLPSQT